jgi:Ca2+-binding RTX toxin-like protein
METTMCIIIPDRTARSRRIRRALLEAMEPRQLLAFTPVPGGVLTISGDDANDTVSLTRAGDALRLNFNSKVFKFRSDDVKSVVVALGAGNNKFVADDAVRQPMVIASRAGNDTLHGGAGNDVISSGGGNDRIIARGGDDTISAGAGNDAITAGAGNDKLSGGDDNDTLSGGAGADLIHGDAGTDLVTYQDSPGGVWVTLDNVADDGRTNGRSGFDLKSVEFDNVFDDVENVDGSKHADFLSGSDKDNVLRGLDGRDSLYGRTGDDRLFGGRHDDVLGGDEGSDLVWGEHGADRMDGGAGYDEVRYDDPGGDRTSGVTVRLPVFGNAYSQGNGAANERDAIRYVEGARGTKFKDKLVGNADDNELYGFGGNDDLSGNDGTDNLYGGAGNDTLRGGAGEDDLWSGSGNDTLGGGAGWDLIRFDSEARNRGVKALLPNPGSFSTGNGDRAANENDRIEGDVEGIEGTEHDDTLAGNAQDNRLIGRGGNDDIHGGDGLDTLFGGRGDDTLYGAGAKDKLMGSDGDDLLDGGADDDLAFGEDGRDTIRGGDGLDSIDGGANDDSLSGDAGNDSLIGGDGADTLAGGDGYDTLRGMRGIDTLDGRDRTVWDTLDGGEDWDLVYRDVLVGHVSGTRIEPTINCEDVR